MDNLPTFKIHGTERRKLKKELAELKSFVKTFWYYHTLDKDMASFYGKSGGYPMSDENAQSIFNEKEIEITILEAKLNEPYIN